MRRSLMTLALMLAPACVAAQEGCGGTDLLPGLIAGAPEIGVQLDAAADVPYARGRFWRIEKDGRVSHAFGTFHAPDPAIATLPKDASAALVASRVVIVEVSPAEKAAGEAALMADPLRFVDLSGPPISTRLAPAEAEALGKLAAEYGLLPQMVQQMRPWFLNVLLSIPPCLTASLAAGAPVLDFAVAETAAASGIPVQGLESVETGIGIFANMPPDDQILLLRLNIAFAHQAEDALASARRLYLDGEVFKIWAMTPVLTRALGLSDAYGPLVERFYQRLLVERNRTWMPKLRPALEAGGAFIAVGALHLSGPDSLQALLAAEGYTITRLDDL